MKKFDFYWSLWLCPSTRIVHFTPQSLLIFWRHTELFESLADFSPFASVQARNEIERHPVG
jgi:hypothetical protein